MVDRKRGENTSTERNTGNRGGQGQDRSSSYSDGSRSVTIENNYVAPTRPAPRRKEDTGSGENE